MSKSKPPVTLKDIASAIGISKSTASRALKNNPRVSVEMRKRVHAFAAELGYQPNPAAATLAQFKRTSSVQPVQAAIAWLNLWPKPETLYSFHQFHRYWEGAHQAAAKFGFRLDEFPVNERMPPGRLEKILLTRNIHGILIPPAPRSTFDWGGLDWTQFSVVGVGRGYQGMPRFQIVTSQQSLNAALAFHKTRELGYKRIGFVGHRMSDWAFLGGFLQAQALVLPEAMHIPAMLFEELSHITRQGELWDTKETLHCFVSWIEKWKPDAILTEDAVVLKLLEKAGRRVPEDIGIAGLNVLDLPFEAGIYQNPEEIGRVAMLVVISLLHDHAFGIPPIRREILIEGKWVDGASLPPRT